MGAEANEGKRRDFVVQCNLEGAAPRFIFIDRGIKYNEPRTTVANVFPDISVGCMRYGPQDIHMLTSTASIDKFLLEDSMHEPLKIVPGVRGGGAESNLKKAWKDHLVDALKVKGGLSKKVAEARITAGVQKLSESAIAEVMIGRQI